MAGSMAWAPLAATGLIVFAGTVLRAVSGLGFSLVAVPLLALVWLPQQAVAIAVLFQSLSTVPLVASHHRHIDWGVLRRACLGAAAGILPGLALLQWLSDTALRLTLTLVLLLSIAVIVAGPRLIRRMTPARIVLAGACAGFGQGLAGVPGPPLMAGLLALPHLDPRAVRVTASAIFLLLGMASVVSLLMHGAYEAMAPVGYAAAILGMACGHLAGEKLFALAGAAGFRRLVLLVLSASALLTLAPLWPN